MENIFFDIGLIIIIATFFGFVAKMFRQPLIPAYILGGVVLGPVGLGLITDINIIKILSEIGIAFMLFVVGLELDFKKLKDIGAIATVGGTVQIVIMFILGFIIGKLLGVFNHTEAIYLGFIVAFSSTIVVIKLLSDKHELDTLHGRIVIGILLMEDIFAIIALSTLKTLGAIEPLLIIISILKGAAILVITIIVSKYVFPLIFRFAAKSQEILFLASLTACFFFSILSHFMGFSITIGAFLAGLAIANLPYNIEIIGKIKPLRDFFATIFFVTLGMEIVFVSFFKMLIPLLLLSLLVILFKPFIIMVISSFFGYKRRTGFLTGISLVQISEFSLIIGMQGLVFGHISQEFFSLVILLSVVTITITTYLIKFDNEAYLKFSPMLRLFDRMGAGKKEHGYEPETKEYDVILIGYNRIGYTITQTLSKIHKNLLVVDFNPDIIKQMVREKVPCIYGDIGDMEILERLNFSKAKIVISTVPDLQDNLLLIRKLKHENHDAVIFVTASIIEEALKLYDTGADYVILPHFLGGTHVALLLEDISSDIKKILNHKTQHLNELKKRREIGHEHPRHHNEYGP